MTCWICGAEADSYEHLIKVSDLRAQFGHVSQDNPLYINSFRHKNFRINSVKKPKVLKFKKPICAQCNNYRTSAYDKSWQILSEYLRRSNPQIRAGDYIRFSKVFSENSRTRMLYVHLYFVKLFGCIANDYNIKINLSDVAKSLLEGKPNSKVFIKFSVSEYLKKYQMVGPSDVHLLVDHSKVVYLVWSYTVGRITVTLTYSESGQNRHSMTNAWHPTLNTRRLLVCDFDAD